MSPRQSPTLTILFCSLWAAALLLSFRTGAHAIDVNPEHLLGLTGASYLASWGPFFLLSRRDPAQIIARFAICTVSIALCLAICELAGAANLVDYRTLLATPTPPWRRPGNRPDSELLYIKEGPRQTRVSFRGAELSRIRGAHSSRVYQTDVHLDRNGFRNASDTARADLIVIGDSFIEGLQVAESDLVTTQLADRLNMTVVNLGRTSYGPQQELEVFRRYGLALRPQACVWAFYEGNDLQDLDNYEAQRKSVYRLVWRPGVALFYDRSFTRNSLEFAIRTWLRPEPMLAARLYTGHFTDRRGRSSELYFATGVQHGEGDPQLPREQCRQLERFRYVLSQAHELCARSGIDLVVAFLPAKFRVYRPYCQFAPDSPCPNWPVNDLAGAIKKIVHEVGPEIAFLNLDPGFQAAAADGELLYLPDDTHWSAEGHRLAAHCITGFLKQRLHTARQSSPESVENQGLRR